MTASAIRVSGRTEDAARVRRVLQDRFTLSDTARALVWVGPAVETPAEATLLLVVAPELGPAELALLRNGTADVVLGSASDVELLARVERLAAQLRSPVTPACLDLINHLPDGAAVVDSNRVVVALNPAGRAILGDPEQVDGRPWDELAQPVDRDAPRSSREPAEVALLNGRRAWLSINVGPMPGGEYHMLSFRDVTAERTLDQNLRQTTDFLEHLIESSSDAIIAADLRGRLIVYNRAAERLFGTPAAQAKGIVNVRDLYPSGGAREVMRLLRESPTGHIEAVRAYGKARGGELIPVELSAALLKMNDREIGSVGLLRDLRERVRVESELARTRARLLEAEKQRDIAAVAGATAHELNQPLTVIFGRADLLLRRSDEATRPHLQAIAEQAERMAEIVRRVANLTTVRTVSYPGERIIADLELSSQREPAAVPVVVE